VGILDRISTILRANINALLDQAEDPEKMLDQLIRDMRDAIREAREQVAEMIAQEKLLEADMVRNQRLAVEWQGKAELAVGRGADDLAREALRRRTDYDRNSQVYAQQLAAQQELVAKLKRDLEQLESKYESAVRNREALIARQRRAVAMQRVAQAAAQLSVADPTSELARMEDRIRQQEARALAAAEVQSVGVEAQFAALEADDDVERQLLELKAKARGALPSPEAAAGKEPSGTEKEETGR